MVKKILLVGGGGHCHSVLDCLLSLGVYDEIGIVERSLDGATPLMGIPVVGTDDYLPKLFTDGWTDAFVTLGSVGNTKRRRRLLEFLQEIGFTIPVIIDPSAVAAKDVTIGIGTFVAKKAVINAGACIGTGVIINTGAIIEHDCQIGGFAHISPGTTLCGQVIVGDDSHIGANSVVRQQIKIGNNTLIGIGSVVVNNIPSGVKAYGNPCKVVSG